MEELRIALFRENVLRYSTDDYETNTIYFDSLEILQILISLQTSILKLFIKNDTVFKKQDINYNTMEDNTEAKKTSPQTTSERTVKRTQFKVLQETETGREVGVIIGVEMVIRYDEEFENNFFIKT